MLILAHRGYHSKAPENTLEAFKEAIALGVDGIETDVRLSADEELVLFHDRRAPNGRNVSEMTRAELSACAGYSVPTLESALELDQHIMWNVEIKVPEATKATVGGLSRFTPQRLLVTSFWHPILERVSDTLDVACGLLVAHRPLDSVTLTDWLPPSRRVRTLVWDFESIDGTVLARSMEAGLRNFVYGANPRAD